MSVSTKSESAAAKAADAARGKKPGRRAISGKQRQDNIYGWLYCAPFVIAFVMFLVWPTISGLVMSFTGRSLTGANTEFIGFANYAEAFADPAVWSSLWNTTWFTVLSVVPLVVIALLLAALVNVGLPGQWLWRLSFFLPFLLASTVVSKFWIWLYNPQLGLINDWLIGLGLDPVPWLQNPDTAMYAVVVTTVWWTIGFNFLLYLAALQNIPDQLYEAASLDGAGRWRKFISITLPQLAPTTALVVTLQILASLKVFDQFYQMTGGGPSGTTRPILQYIYEVGFTGYRLGYASAISYIFFFLIVAISVLFIVLRGKKKVKP